MNVILLLLLLLNFVMVMIWIKEFFNLYSERLLIIWVHDDSLLVILPVAVQSVQSIT